MSELGSPGYTEVDGPGIGTATADDRLSITVPIFFLDKTQNLRITYGATDEGRAVAATTTGTDTFKIEVKGHEGGLFKAIRSQPTVRVTGQGSGRGKAVLTVNPVRAILPSMPVIRTVGSQLFTPLQDKWLGAGFASPIPPNWPAPSTSNLIVRPSTSVRYDGQMATIEGVNLAANGKINFIYTANVQPRVETGVTFAVEVHSGVPGDSFAEVSGSDTTLTVDVKRRDGVPVRVWSHRRVSTLVTPG